MFIIRENLKIGGHIAFVHRGRQNQQQKFWFNYLKGINNSEPLGYLAFLYVVSLISCYKKVNHPKIVILCLKQQEKAIFLTKCAAKCHFPIKVLSIFCEYSVFDIV